MRAVRRQNTTTRTKLGVKEVWVTPLDLLGQMCQVRYPSPREFQSKYLLIFTSNWLVNNLLDNSSVVINFGCQLYRIYNNLRDKTLGISIKTILHKVK